MKNFEDMFTRFDRIHERDGRTDRWTHTRDGTGRVYAEHRAAKKSTPFSNPAHTVHRQINRDDYIPPWRR